MTRKFSHRLTLSLVALAVAAILLTGLAANAILNWNFRRYLRSTQEAQNERIIATLEELYSEAISWNAVRHSTWYVGNTTGTHIQVFDLQGQLIADSLAGMMQGMHGMRRRGAVEQRGTTYEYALLINGQEVGTVEITHLEQEGLFDREALLFRRTVAQAMAVATLVLTAAALLAGKLLSEKLTVGLARMSEAARRLGRGDLSARVAVAGDDELAVLANSMNEMAARLQEQNNLRKKLTSDISHELRTPLTTIRSYLEAFRDGVMPADEKNLSTVLEETSRLGNLVADLHELAVVDCREQPMKMVPVDLNEFVSKETERFRAAMERGGIAFHFRPSGDAARILADETMLARVLGNLLSNALKYTPEGGEVAVEVLAGGKRAGFTVRDSGIGVAGEHLPYIFERFYRADPSRSRATGGSGIGLALVQELVHSMGGVVSVQSEPGKGSEFRVEFPTAP